MANEVIESPQQRGLVMELRTSRELVARSREIEQVVAEVMEPGVHYGVIPGTPKPSLYRAGADRLASAFFIAADYQQEEISNADEVSYRVKCIGSHAPSGIVLGAAIGECSSNEEKYKWRRPVCKEEFEEFPADRKRRKWKRGKNNSSYVEEQVRTEPADVRNTISQMAQKRAFVAMIRSVTGVSSIFGQDLEDMPEEIRAQLIEARSERHGRDEGRSNTTQRQQPKATANAPTVANEGQVKLLLRKLDDAGMSAETLCKKFGVNAIAELPFDKVNAALEFIKDPEREAIQQQGATP
jgi:hypothetical protein